MPHYSLTSAEIPAQREYVVLPLPIMQQVDVHHGDLMTGKTATVQSP